MEQWKCFIINYSHSSSMENMVCVFVLSSIHLSMIMLFIRYKTREAQLKMDLQLKQMEKQNIEISHNMGRTNVHQFLT